MAKIVDVREPVAKREGFDLEERLIDFAVRVITVVEALPATRAGNHVANQLVRCGTSPAPNYAEAQSAESRNDFIHKLKVCLKELRETRVWLLVIQRKPLIKPSEKLVPLITEGNELISIFVASIRTTQRNREKEAIKLRGHRVQRINEYRTVRKDLPKSM